MHELLNDIRSLQRFFSEKDYRKIAVLFALMLFDAVLAAIGVGVIPAYMAFLLNPSVVEKIPYLAGVLPLMPARITTFLAVTASVVLILVISIKNISSIFTAHVQLRFVNGLLTKMSETLFAGYQSAPYAWHLGTCSSELIRKIQHDPGEVVNRVLMSILDFLKNTLILLSLLWMMAATLHWSVNLILLMMGLGMLGLQTAMKQKIKQTGAILREELKKTIQHVQQAFGAIVDTRLLGREQFFLNSFQKSVRRAARARVIQGTLMRATPALIEILSVLVLLMAFLVQINTRNSLEQSLPGLTLLVVAVLRLKQIATTISQSFNSIHSGRVYLPSLVDDLERHTRHGEQQKKEKMAILGARFDELRLDAVTYSYDNTDKPAIDAIDLVIRRGESIGLVGPTGSGKSTLVNVILGLLIPQQGEIQVNGMQLHNDRTEWWRMIGYVPQTIYLIDDTIRANIAFGIPEKEIDQQKLTDAVRSAQLEKFINELPQGLDTVVGERGVRLSGGQRQRIGIARALYPDPQVFIMDEATSALDNQTEKDVMVAIERLMGERTMIMIAHRLTTVEKCDRLYLLHAGQIVNHGKYENLINESQEFVF